MLLASQLHNRDVTLRNLKVLSNLASDAPDVLLKQGGPKRQIVLETLAPDFITPLWKTTLSYRWTIARLI